MNSEPRRQTITTPDGRDLEVVSAGPEDGRCFLWHSGTPSSAGIFGPSLAAAAERGLRYVTFSRPGYSTSTPNPGRSVGDVAQDVTTILDALGFDTFLCGGQSGGGPHALACAALLPDRVLATATLAGVAPWPAEGLDWFAGMGPENLVEFEASMKGAEALTPLLDGEADHLRVVEAAEIAAALGGLVSDVDKRALTGAYAEHMAGSFHRAFSTSTAGWRDDDLAFVHPWGFDIGTIRTPVAIWQGGEDRMVPMQHGEWLAAHIPGAEQHMLPAEGHLSLANNKFGDVLDGLLSMADIAPKAARTS
ncbi:MAG TPA: alpha/beta fold hydrolase [Candidatus Saccharimonadales bacterium]|nr:alpha/beta fold hydrolase [Candidatus Saccharimonadales bacterium]